MRRSLFIIIAYILSFGGVYSARAVDFAFTPDSARATIGNEIVLAGNVGATEPLRGFTIYLLYDTSRLELASAPEPGALIATRAGLDFRWLDHVPSEPDWLEIGATVFSSDFWSGPGELFRLHLRPKRCGDVPLLTPYGIELRTAANTAVNGAVSNPLIFICDPIPRPPAYLTIAVLPTDSIRLRWFGVTLDTVGRPLPAAPLYRVMRSKLHPQVVPPTQVALVADTVYVEPLADGAEYLYDVIARTSP